MSSLGLKWWSSRFRETSISKLRADSGRMFTVWNHVCSVKRHFYNDALQWWGHTQQVLWQESWTHEWTPGSGSAVVCALFGYRSESYVDSFVCEDWQSLSTMCRKCPPCILQSFWKPNPSYVMLSSSKGGFKNSAWGEMHSVCLWGVRPLYLSLDSNCFCGEWTLDLFRALVQKWRCELWNQMAAKFCSGGHYWLVRSLWPLDISVLSILVQSHAQKLWRNLPGFCIDFGFEYLTQKSWCLKLSQTSHNCNSFYLHELTFNLLVVWRWKFYWTFTQIILAWIHSDHPVHPN